MLDTRVTKIFEALLDLDPIERPAFLESTCGGDAGLESEVLALLRALEETATSPFLSIPPTDGDLPETIGKYEIRRKLGRGAFGLVFLAVDPDLHREIALKTLPRSLLASPERRNRLREEALALASLSHPNIAHLHTFEEGPVRIAGSEESAAFLTMEYVNGVTLAEHLHRSSLGLEEAIDISRQIATAVEAAHRADLVHRDLKPQNILIDTDGWVKVLDFGLSLPREFDSAGIEELGRESEAFAGTPGYMSPEQIRGSYIDARSDIWAFGSIAFECLSGVAAFDGAGLGEMIEATHAGRVPWERLPEAIPERLRTQLQRCLTPEPDRRPESITPLRHLLEEELLRIRSAPFVRTAPERGEMAHGNLPQHQSAFVGRSEVLRGLGELADNCRLLTLTGVGGTGKTRTAIELARQITHRFPDGVWLIEMAELTEASELERALVQVLELGGTSDGRDIDRVVELLQDQRALLLFDNCEHLIEPVAALVQKLLERCPELFLIASSREPLRLPLEQVFPLPPLAVPDPEGQLGSIEESDSVRLFSERARARNPKFVLDGDGVRLVARICGRLEGLPIAIELAAGQSRTISLEELAQRLEEDPRFLSERDRTREMRHRSLDGLLEWSHRLLDETERRLFGRLAMFRGGWSLRAAETVCADDRLEAWEVCETLSRLVERSLVEVETRGVSVRYRFLEIVRLFAQSRWDDDPDEAGRGASLAERHADFFAETLAPMGTETGWTHSGWMARVRLDSFNLRRALERSRASSNRSRTLRLASILGRLESQEGYWRDGLEMLQEIRSSEGGSSTPPRTTDESVSDLVLIHAYAGQMAAMLDEFEQAGELTEAGVRLAPDRSLERARMAWVAGLLAYYKVELAESERCFREAVQLYRELDDPAGLASSLADLARVRSVQSDHESAQPLYRESLQLHRELDDQLGSARILLNLGRTAQLLGRDEEALELMKEALEEHRAAGDLPGAGTCLQALGDAVRLIERDLDTAREHLVECVEIRYRTGQKQGVFSALIDLAYLATDQGEPRRGAEILGGVIEGHAVHHLRVYDGVQQRVGQLKDRLVEEIGMDQVERAWSVGERKTLRELVRLVAPSRN